MTYDGLTSEVERSTKIAETHQSSFDKVHESLNRLHAKALDLEQLICATVKPVAAHNGGAANHMDEIDTSDTIWSFQASLQLPMPSSIPSRNPQMAAFCVWLPVPPVQQPPSLGHATMPSRTMQAIPKLHPAAVYLPAVDDSEGGFPCDVWTQRRGTWSCASRQDPEGFARRSGACGHCV